MTHTTAPDIEALERLLDELIAAPVNKAMTVHLKKTQDGLKALGSDLGDVKEAAEASDRRSKVVLSKLDDLADRIDALAEAQRQWREEWREAQALMAQEGRTRDEAAALSRQRRLYRLTLLALGAGLLSAAAVELLHGIV